MLIDAAMSNPSYEALSNDEGTAGSCNATVQQTLAKIPWETATDRVKMTVHRVAHLNRFARGSLISARIFFPPAECQA